SAWARALGIETFVGTSGRVFPSDLKAAPLLRAWLHRLRAGGVRLHARHRWTGFGAPRGSPDGAIALRFATPDGPREGSAARVVLALGGASWARLGSDGAWVAPLRAAGVDVAALQPANCGFVVASPRADAPDGSGWSAPLRTRFAGQPLKNVAFLPATSGAQAGVGECVLTEDGLEGSLVYAWSGAWRDALATGPLTVHLDLLPARDPARVLREVTHPRGARSWASLLASRLGLDPLRTALLRECAPAAAFDDPPALAALLKALPIPLRAPRPIDRAISSAGGVRFDAIDASGAIHGLPGVWCAGEMVDWEAPTGGYLLTACLASGVVAGRAVAASLGGADRAA
nr:TIGR03862 family flavoprotein [Burkholderiales bacterium]